MIYVASILFLVLCLYVKKSKERKEVSKENHMFSEELQKIKSDSVLNFIDTDFLEKNFELFGDMKFALAANDEGNISYPITSLQDLYPNDFA